jgi:hypothetical protein
MFPFSFTLSYQCFSCVCPRTLSLLENAVIGLANYPFTKRLVESRIARQQAVDDTFTSQPG